MTKLKYVGKVEINYNYKTIPADKYIKYPSPTHKVYYKTADGWIKPHQIELENITEVITSINSLFKQTYGGKFVDLFKQTIFTQIGDF